MDSILLIQYLLLIPNLSYFKIIFLYELYFFPSINMRISRL